MDPSEAVIETAASPSADSAMERGDIGPDDRVERFIAKLSCAGCGEETLSSGRSYLAPEWDDDEEREVWGAVRRIEWLSDYPRLVQDPKGVPWDISRELRVADKLFWCDLASCLTTLRRSVEVFLDLQGVSRQAPTKSGGSKFRSLEDRIDEFLLQEEIKSLEKADRYEVFMRATKVLGNDGTHGNSEITGQDVRLAAGFVERVLAVRYGEEDELLNEARRLVASVAPSPRTKRKLAALAQATPISVVAAAPSKASVVPGGTSQAPALHGVPTSSSPGPAASSAAPPSGSTPPKP